MVEAVKPFAGAMYEIAQEENKTDLFLEQLSQIRDVLCAEPAFLQALAHPKVEKAVKKQWLKELFENQVDDMIVNSLEVLADYSLAQEIDSLYAAFEGLYKDDHQIETVNVQSAAPLSEEQVENLKNMLKEKLGRQVELEVTIHPELIAGLRVKTDKFVLDNSILTRLNTMKEKLNS